MIEIIADIINPAGLTAASEVSQSHKSLLFLFVLWTVQQHKSAQVWYYGHMFSMISYIFPPLSKYSQTVPTTTSA